MKNIQWDIPQNVGVISNEALKPIHAIPEPGDNIVAIYKGIKIRLRTVYSTDSNAISAEILCADSTSDELPDDLTEGEFVEVDRAHISWVRFKK